MKVEVSNGISELQRQFSGSSLTVLEDGQGGAYVFIETVPLGPRYQPPSTWLGFQIPAQYPYADVYPLFMASQIVRADGTPFVAPVTHGHNFQGRPAIQISRRYGAAQSGTQNATAKILKVLHFLETMP